jgi:WD40 repeat protein
MMSGMTGAERAEVMVRMKFGPASRDETARVWDAASGAAVATMAGHAGTVEDVASRRPGRC